MYKIPPPQKQLDGLAPVIYRSDQELGKADVLIFNFTDYCATAMNHVFFHSENLLIPSATGYIQDMQPYTKGFVAEWWHNPFLRAFGSNAWGYFANADISGKKVVQFKLELPFKYFPNLLHGLLGHLLDVVDPELVLMQNAVGGTNSSQHVGDVIANNSSKYLLTNYMAHMPYNHKTFSTGYTPNFDQILDIQSSYLRPPTTRSFLDHVARESSIFPGFVDLPQNIPRLPHPILHTDLSQAQMTTNSFVVGTTSGDYSEYAGIGENIAPVYRACEEKKHPSTRFFSSYRRLDI